MFIIYYISENMNKNSNKSLEFKVNLIINNQEEGNKHFQQENYEQAIMSYSKAIELDSNNPIFYSNSNIIYKTRICMLFSYFLI